MVAKISIGSSLYGALAYHGEKINQEKGKLLVKNADFFEMPKPSHMSPEHSHEMTKHCHVLHHMKRYHDHMKSYRTTHDKKHAPTE